MHMVLYLAHGCACVNDTLSTSRIDEVYADEPYLSIHLDREHKVVLSECKGFANTLEFRAGNLKVLEAIRDTHADSLVIDNRKMERVTPSDRLWIRNTFVHSLESAGLRRVVMVVSHYGLAKIATAAIRSQTTN
jgi:hypothetical protein